jgi:hypothetical protein
MELKDLYGRSAHDTRVITRRRGGVRDLPAVRLRRPVRPADSAPSDRPIPDFAHIGRRFEYITGRGIFYGEPTTVPPEIWLSCKRGEHAECLRHPPKTTVNPPDSCECPCHPPDPTSANVDDLLG